MIALIWSIASVLKGFNCVCTKYVQHARPVTRKSGRPSEFVPDSIFLAECRIPPSKASRATLHRQEKPRRLVESYTHLFGLVDELLHAVGQLLARIGKGIGAGLQVGQSALAGRRVCPIPTTARRWWRR